MAGLMTQRKEILLENKIYHNSSDFEKEINIFKNHKDLNNQNFDEYIDVIDETKHSMEITNWLDLKV